MGLIDIDGSGVKQSAEVPPTAADSGVNLIGTPPIEEDVPIDVDIFTDELTGQPAVPVTVLQKVRDGERAKREALEAKLRELEQQVQQVPSVTPSVPPESEIPEEPSFDWSITQQALPTQGGQMSREQVQAYNEELRGRLEADPMGTLVQMFSQFYGAVKAQEEGMHAAAKRFVPTYNELPLDEVTQDEMRYVSGNPEVLKAVLAYLKKGKAMGKPPRATPAATAEAPKTDQVTLAAAVEELRRQVGAVASSNGLSGEAPGATAPETRRVNWGEFDPIERQFLSERVRRGQLSQADLEKQLDRLRKLKAGDRGNVLDI
jgi:hypothetical protein